LSAASCISQASSTASPLACRSSSSSSSSSRGQWHPRVGH
jgi:hypothetical protein